MRRWRAALAIGLIMLAVGAIAMVFTGFEIGTRKLKGHYYLQVIDSAIGPILSSSTSSVTEPASVKSSHTTGLVRLDATARRLDFSDDPAGAPGDDTLASGGMTSFGDDVLLLSFNGRIYAGPPGENLRVSGLSAPMVNRAALAALKEDPRYADYGFAPDALRYNDILYFSTTAGRGLLASYTQFDPVGVCIRNIVNTPKASFVVFLSLTELVGTEAYDGLNIYYIGDYVPPEHEYMSMEPAALKKR